MKNKLIKKIVSFFLAVLILLTFCAASYASSSISFLERNAKVLKLRSAGLDLVRKAGWEIIKFAASVGDIAADVYDKGFGFIDVTKNQSIMDFVDTFRPLIVSIVIISVLCLGIMLILNHEKKPQLMTNIIILYLCVFGLPIGISFLNDISHGFYDYIVPSPSGEKTSAVSIISQNTVDVYRSYKEYGDSLTEDEYQAISLSKGTISAIDINETMDKEGSLKYYYYINDEGEPDIKALGFKFFRSSEEYYRYIYDFIPIVLELGALILVYVSLAYKCLRIAFELIFSSFLATLFSAELSGVEKVRKTLIYIRDSYIILWISLVSIKVYTLLTEYLASLGWNTFIKSVFSLFIAFCVIDGPNVAQRLLGMDAGLSSSVGRVLGIAAGARTLARIGGTAVKDAAAVGAAAGKLIKSSGKDNAAQRTAKSGNRSEKFAPESENKASEGKKTNKSDSFAPKASPEKSTSGQGGEDSLSVQKDSFSRQKNNEMKGNDSFAPKASPEKSSSGQKELSAQRETNGEPKESKENSVKGEGLNVPSEKEERFDDELQNRQETESKSEKFNPEDVTRMPDEAHALRSSTPQKSSELQKSRLNPEGISGKLNPGSKWEQRRAEQEKGYSDEQNNKKHRK